jgi:hypothetical protein
MDITFGTNLKTVDEFVAEIRHKVQNATKNWWEIANAFSEASEMFGTDSDRFKELCRKTEFSKSKVTKLVKIVQSDRLKSYALKLSAVHSWGTLYAVTTLNDEAFQRMKEAYKLDDEKSPIPFLTQPAVERFAKEKTERSPFKRYALIEMDEDALKGSLITGEDSEKLHDFMEQINALSSYIRVTRTDIDEKETAKYMTRIEDKIQQIARKTFLDTIRQRVKSRPRAENETVVQHELRCLGLSREELIADFNADAEEAFKYLGLEYSYPQWYREAENEVSSQMDRFAQKALKRPVVEKPRYEPRQTDKEFFDEMKVKAQAERSQKKDFIERVKLVEWT